MAHSWVMAFEDEVSAFDAYAEALPAQCVFLVDTYHTIEGIKKAIEVGKKVVARGYEFLGVRLDSGDLAYLSIKARELLDAAGFVEAKIFASNELDELIIRDLIQQGAQINVWGVGTNLVTSKGHPALDGVYKMSALKNKNGHWDYKIKCSEQMHKTSNPGILQVRRFKNDYRYLGDATYDINLSKNQDNWTIIDPLNPIKRKPIQDPYHFRDLLIPIFREGKRVYNPPTLEEIKEKISRELSFFHKGIKRFLFPHQYPYGLEQKLYEKKVSLIEKMRSPHEECLNYSGFAE
jgi:nicotinate phosphoribosyltransferase